jgi:hypothetical protein
MNLIVASSFVFVFVLFFFFFFSRCQIAVHQECYGARNVRDFTSWVCKACETPEIKRECCLCPVKGMFVLIELNFMSFDSVIFFFFLSFFLLSLSLSLSPSFFFFS